MIKEFKEFALKGNVMDLAVGVIIGAAFGKIVSSVVTDIITPVLSILTGKIDFNNLYFDLSRGNFSDLASAQAAGVPVVTYGAFLNNIIEFIIVAFVLFLVVKQIGRFRKEPETTTTQCNFCLSEIPKEALRCRHCTSDIAHL